MGKDCINCEEWIEGPLADCSRCNGKVPNKITRKVIEDCEKGIGLKSFDTIEELFKDLNGESKNGSRVIKDDD